MLTQSGILVTPDNLNCPTVEDVAVSLGRMPRYAGHTSGWWTVLHHSLVCLRIAEKLAKSADVQLWCLWHDAHESITGDIPTTWKTPEIRVMQNRIDERFMDYLRLSPSLADLSDVEAVDRLAFLAESWVVGPPGIRQWAKLDRPPLFVATVTEIRKMFRGAVNTAGPATSGVRRFVHETASLQNIRQKDS